MIRRQMPFISLQLSLIMHGPLQLDCGVSGVGVGQAQSSSGVGVGVPKADGVGLFVTALLRISPI
jgi:hypothetical protein